MSIRLWIKHFRYKSGFTVSFVRLRYVILIEKAPSFVYSSTTFIVTDRIKTIALQSDQICEDQIRVSDVSAKNSSCLLLFLLSIISIILLAIANNNQLLSIYYRNNFFNYLFITFARKKYVATRARKREGKKYARLACRKYL